MRFQAVDFGRAMAAMAEQYVHAYPEPAGYGDRTLRTPEAFYDQTLGQFILPYDAVSQAPGSEAKFLGFL
jgi:hypothetical protein